MINGLHLLHFVLLRQQGQDLPTCVGFFYIVGALQYFCRWHYSALAIPCHFVCEVVGREIFVMCFVQVWVVRIVCTLLLYACLF
jgi:hypothetical protein